MPNYDFKCRRCQIVFERIVPATVTVVNCPKCIPHMVQVQNKMVSLPTYSDRQLSAPSIRPNGIILSEKEINKIKEPLIQDLESGAIWSAN